MKDQFENYINENRDQFNADRPDLSVWKNVRDELHPEKKKRSPFLIVSSIAAVAVILVGIITSLNYLKEIELSPQAMKKEKDQDKITGDESKEKSVIASNEDTVYVSLKVKQSLPNGLDQVIYALDDIKAYLYEYENTRRNTTSLDQLTPIDTMLLGELHRYVDRAIEFRNNQEYIASAQIFREMFEMFEDFDIRIQSDSANLGEDLSKISPELRKGVRNLIAENNLPSNIKWREVTQEENLHRRNYNAGDNVDYLEGDNKDSEEYETENEAFSGEGSGSGLIVGAGSDAITTGPGNFSISNVDVSNYNSIEWTSSGGETLDNVNAISSAYTSSEKSEIIEKVEAGNRTLKNDPHPFTENPVGRELDLGYFSKKGNQDKSEFRPFRGNVIKSEATFDQENQIKLNYNGSKQGILDGVYVQEHIPTKKVIQYSSLREAGAKWKKVQDKRGRKYLFNPERDQYMELPAETTNTENYEEIHENDFIKVLTEPQSTFSVDVDVASYSNVRRHINRNTLPPRDAVRLEEMINYFDYKLDEPQGEHPFSITTEMGPCPWNKENRLVHISLKGMDVDQAQMPNNNLVFLLDVSGSMNSTDKIELLKKGFTMLTNELRKEDKVSIVVYAGAAGLVLPPTRGNDKVKIIGALDNLSAGGSTAGGEGIRLAYKIARENFQQEGNNRVILATDGDFNVGVSSNQELVKLIEKERESGVFLSVMGFGTGNLQDSKMEKLADNGNGNYFYIDNILEAKKVMVTDLRGTILTIAKDVKLQLEFNPMKVKSYRLIGYENRLLANKDFDDDTKDAGEIGSGHTVTALYEVVPQTGESKTADAGLKYQQQIMSKDESLKNEVLTVKFRYKRPDADKSKLIVKTLNWSDTKEMSETMGFASSVAEYGLILRGSKYKANSNFKQILENAKKYKGEDVHGYREEFINMVKRTELLMGDIWK